MPTRSDLTNSPDLPLAEGLRSASPVQSAVEPIVTMPPPQGLASVLDESCPVRYHFESQGALHRHLAARPFFIPHPQLACAPGGRVIVEVDFAGAVEQSLLRGRVIARQPDGLTLDLAFTHPTAWWDAHGGQPRRNTRRLGCDLFAEVQPKKGAHWFCRAVDIGEGGVRLATGLFQSLLAGDHTTVTLTAADPSIQPVRLEGRVAWAWGREAGVAVEVASPELRALVDAVASRWQTAEEVQHQKGCHCASRPRQP
jgi:hypothetical protein